MQQVGCVACQTQVPKGQAFDAAGRTMCAGCLQKMLDSQGKNASVDGIARLVDSTVCVHCSADGGTAEWPQLLGLPTCEACNHLFHHRPFPNWLKISAALFLCVAVVAFAHNWRFFSAYVNYLRGLRALEQEHVEEGIALLDSAAKRVPEVPDLAVLPNLLIAQKLVAEDKNEEALQLLAQSASHVSDSFRIAFKNTESSAQMGAAFNRGDYDAFLEAARAFAENSPNEPVAVGSIASAYACKYATTGEPEFRAKCLEELERARALAGPDDLEFREYEGRIAHRLDSRRIISREEFIQQFPNGYKSETKP